MRRTLFLLLGLICSIGIASAQQLNKREQLGNLERVTVTLHGFDDEDARKCGVLGSEPVKNSFMLPINSYTKIQDDPSLDAANLTVSALILSTNAGCVAHVRVEAYTFVRTKLRHRPSEALQLVQLYDGGGLIVSPAPAFPQRLQMRVEEYGKAFAVAWQLANK